MTGREGNLAYHNSLMVQFWSALASRGTRLMTHVLQSHFPPVLTNATYATYLRCHDDIGWAVTDEDAAAVGLSGPAHRAFLSDFYEGGFPGSFARRRALSRSTIPRPATSASAAAAPRSPGWNARWRPGTRRSIDRAIDRILMGHALIASFGGIPLIYMGDEIALLNDPPICGARTGP
jgi:amylosucrase